MPQNLVIVIAAIAGVFAACLVNQIPPLKTLVTRVAQTLANWTQSNPRWWKVGIYVAVVISAVAATVAVTLLVSGASSGNAAQSTVGSVKSSPPSTSYIERPKISIDPSEGPPGTGFHASAAGFKPGEVVRFEIFEGAYLHDFAGPYMLGDMVASSGGEVAADATIPREICCSGAIVKVRATSIESHVATEVIFTIH